MSGDNDGPKKSSYQSTYAPDTVYQPNVNTSDSDETAAQSTYQSIYGTTGKPSSDSGGDSGDPPPAVKYPTLKMAYTTAPHLEPFNPPVAVDPKDPVPPAPAELKFPISINLAALRTAENSFLTATKALVDDYENTLVPEVKAAIASTTLFGQNVTTTSTSSFDPAAHQGGLGDEITSGGSGLTYDQLDESGKAFAAAINPEMTRLLQSIGDVVELLGQFTACINQAGQLYATADHNSAFPAPEDMIGPIVHKS